jgi:hypothetical protein
MDSNDVTVGAELEAVGPDGRWHPVRVLRRCGPEGAPTPNDCLFDVLAGGRRGHRRASEMRPRRRWPLRLLSPILDLLRPRAKRPRREAGQTANALLRGAEELVRRALSAADGDPRLEACLTDILRDIALASEAAAETELGDMAKRRDPPRG